MKFKLKMTRYRILLLLAIVVLLALPPLFGIAIEAQVRAQADALREEGRLLVTVEQYDRGWFTSEALLLVEPGSASDPSRQGSVGLAAPMNVLVDLKHGPVSFQDGIFLGFSELYARPAPSDVPARFGFEFRAQSTFGGNVNFVGEIAPFETETADFAVSLSGGRFQGTAAGRHLEARLAADSVQYTSGPVRYSLLGVQATVDNERVSRYAVPGVMTLRVDRMAVDLDGQERSTLFELRALAAESSTALDDTRERLSGALRVELERLIVGSDEITGGRLETAAERIDVAALEAYANAAARAADNGSVLADEVEPAVLRLLAENPALSIDTLRFDVNGEPFEANAQAAVDGAGLPPAGAADVRDLGFWMGVTDGYAEVILAKSLAERIAVTIAKSQIGSGMRDGDSMPGESVEALARMQAGLAIAMLSAQGMLEDTGDVYRTELRLEDRALSVNGTPLPFFGAP